MKKSRNKKIAPMQGELARETLEQEIVNLDKHSFGFEVFSFEPSSSSRLFAFSFKGYSTMKKRYDKVDNLSTP